MGSVETLPSGRHRAMAWNPLTKKKLPIKNPEPGSRGSWSSYEEADAAWRVAERQWDTTYSDGGIEVVRKRRRLTFAEYAKAWAEVAEGEMNTRTTKNTHVRILNKTFGGFLIDDISPMDVRRWHHQERVAGHAPSTRQGRLITLGQIMRRAVQDHLRPDDPTVDITVIVPKKGASDARILTDQELSLAQSFLPAWFRPAALLACDSGLRAAEVSGLRWFRLDLADPLTASVKIADVLERDGSLRNHPKGKKHERLPVTPRTAAALIELRKMFPGDDMDFVFRLSKAGSPPPANAVAPRVVLPKYITKLWADARTSAKLDQPPVKFHHLRHACATNLARAGYSAMVIKKVLRHANLSTSQIYIEAEGDAEVRAAMTAVSEAKPQLHLLAG